MNLFLDLEMQAKKKKKKDLSIRLIHREKTPWVKSIIRGTHITREIPNSQRLTENKKW